MALSRSCCCSFCMYVFLAIVALLLAIIVKHKSDERSSPKPRDTNDDYLEHELVDAVQELRYDLIRRFPDKKVKAMPLLDGVKGGIKTVEWLNRSSFDEAVDEKRPFVLYDSPAMQWEALSWDLWNISTKWPLLNNVLVTEDESFMILTQEKEEEDESGGLLGVTKTKASNPDVIFEMLFTNFLFHAASPNVYMLYSSNYRVMESIAKLSKHTSWRKFRIIESILDNAKLPQNTKLKQPAPGITFAHPGVSMQAKYSPLHTCRIQLLGIGRFFLFPPAKQSSLYLYPAIHTSRQQSQVLMDEELSQDIHPADSKFPLFKSQAAPSTRSVTLNPGDVLYIPPYWLVRAEFPLLSVFLDVPSLSEELLHFKEAEFTNVPLGKMAENPDERIIGAQVYLMHFLSRVEGLKSPKKFADNHYKSRYSVLYPKNGLYMRKNKFTCFSDDSEYHTSVVNKLNREAIETSAQHAANCVNEPSISSGIRWMFVGDYVDKISRWAMQDPEKAVLFLTTCLSFDKKLQVIEEVEGPSVINIGANAVDKDGKKSIHE